MRLNMLGVEILMTDSPENTKAVLSTKVIGRSLVVRLKANGFADVVEIPQFADFGKGQAFHKIWYDLMADSVFASKQRSRIINMRILTK